MVAQVLSDLQDITHPLSPPPLLKPKSLILSLPFRYRDKPASHLPLPAPPKSHFPSPHASPIHIVSSSPSQSLSSPPTAISWLQQAVRDEVALAYPSLNDLPTVQSYVKRLLFIIRFRNAALPIMAQIMEETGPVRQQEEEAGVFAFFGISSHRDVQEAQVLVACTRATYEAAHISIAVTTSSSSSDDDDEDNAAEDEDAVDSAPSASQKDGPDHENDKEDGAAVAAQSSSAPEAAATKGPTSSAPPKDSSHPNDTSTDESTAAQSAPEAFVEHVLFVDEGAAAQSAPEAHEESVPEADEDAATQSAPEAQSKLVSPTHSELPIDEGAACSWHLRYR